MMESDRIARSRHASMPAVQQQPTRVFQDHAVTALFFQAITYDTKGERYLVVDVTNTNRGAAYNIQTT